MELSCLFTHSSSCRRNNWSGSSFIHLNYPFVITVSLFDELRILLQCLYLYMTEYWGAFILTLLNILSNELHIQLTYKSCLFCIFTISNLVIVYKGKSPCSIFTSELTSIITSASRLWTPVSHYNNHIITLAFFYRTTHGSAHVILITPHWQWGCKE